MTDPSNMLAIGGLAGIGAFLGVNFGGSMLFVTPLLVAMGYSPSNIVASSRPAILAQGCIGLFFFRDHAKIDRNSHFVLAVSSAIGGLLGFGLIRNLPYDAARVVVLGGVLALSILFIKKTKLSHFFGENDGYSPTAIPIRWIIVVGLLPSILAGLLGTGAGLVVFYIAVFGLQQRPLSASYLEKIVTVSQSATILIAVIFTTDLQREIAAPLFVGNIVGSYFGAKISLGIQPLWIYLVVFFMSAVFLLKIFFG